ncbi:MAG: hypothetical protein WC900_08445 [Oscillospiraceae bacterium]
MESFSFVTKYSNSVFKLELAKTLLHFIEFDFSYFYEQSIALGKQASKSGDYSAEQSGILRNLASKCHPYFEAMANFDFNDIVADCIIEHICRNENIGLEALWSSCISPSNSYEKTIFTRISEYKTSRAINEWVNLVRIQEYARTKAAFVFEGDPCSPAECRARCKYFDLAYSVVAKETGYPSDQLCTVSRFSTTQMPNSVFIIQKASKDIYKRLSEKLSKAPEPAKVRINDVIRDSYALDAFDYIREMTRPPDFEMYAAIENMRNFDDVIYLPNSFKAIIDLEIEKMLDAGLMLLKCSVCSRFFIRDVYYTGKLCDRVKSTGLSCREEAEAGKAIEISVADDIDKKSEEIYKNLYNKIGQAIPKNEFNDWSEYLFRLKNNDKNKNASVEDLEAFLDYTEKMYGEIKEE